MKQILQHEYEQKLNFPRGETDYRKADYSKNLK